MKKYRLIIGSFESSETFQIDGLDNVNQLYGAMRFAVESGYRLIDFSIILYDE